MNRPEKIVTRHYGDGTINAAPSDRGFSHRSNAIFESEYTRSDIADARVAAAYEAAARWHNENSEHDQHGLDYSALVGIPISNAAELASSVEMHTYSADHIRALTPADAKAALEAVRREARAEALREAAQELSDCGEHQAVPCILALIDKETTE